MDEQKRSIGDLMRDAMEHIHVMADVNTIVGDPIQAGEVTLIPISRVSAGFACGDTDFSSDPKADKAKSGGGGGGGAGVNVDPMGMLVIRGDSVRLLPILPPATGAVDRAVELLPEVLDKLADYLDKRKEKKDIQDF